MVLTSSLEVAEISCEVAPISVVVAAISLAVACCSFAVAAISVTEVLTWMPDFCTWPTSPVNSSAMRLNPLASAPNSSRRSSFIRRVKSPLLTPSVSVTSCPSGVTMPRAVK